VVRLKITNITPSGNESTEVVPMTEDELTELGDYLLMYEVGSKLLVEVVGDDVPLTEEPDDYEED
jgi:hypothetical protein